MKKLIFTFLLVMAASFVAVSAESQVIVIANSGVKATDITKSEVRDVFLGAASNLRDGSHVTPALLKQGSTHEEFLTLYIGKNDAGLRARWRSLVFSGQTSMPKSVDSDAAMVEFVAHSPGVIGYISKASPHEGVKVLLVK